MTLPKGGLVPVPPWVMVGLRAPPCPAWMCTPHLWAPTGTEQVQTLETELPSGWEDGRAVRGEGAQAVGGPAEKPREAAAWEPPPERVCCSPEPLTVTMTTERACRPACLSLLAKHAALTLVLD